MQRQRLIEPAHRAGEQQKILETLLSGESIDNFETEGVRKDGNVITVSLTVSPVTDANGRIVSTAIIARDTTELLAMLDGRIVEELHGTAISEGEVLRAISGSAQALSGGA